MYYVTDAYGTPIIANWFTDPEVAFDAALKLGFEGFVVCRAGGDREEY